MKEVSVGELNINGTMVQTNINEQLVNRLEIFHCGTHVSGTVFR